MKSLADVVAASGLHGYAEVALVIFFIVFVAIAFRVLLTPGKDLERAAHMPLDDDSSPSPSPAAPDDGAAR